MHDLGGRPTWPPRRGSGEHPDLLDNAPWAVSFLILALAPMPLFAGFELLTAVMSLWG